MAKFGHTRDRVMNPSKYKITLQHRVVVDSVPNPEVKLYRKVIKIPHGKGPEPGPSAVGSLDEHY